MKKTDLSNGLLIVCQSADFLNADVANEAFKRYRNVVLLCSGLSTMERPLDSRVRLDNLIRYDNGTAFHRIFTWGWATIQIFHKIFWHYRHFDVIYYTNPPMSYFCSRVFRNRYRVVVWDLYPDALRTVGIGPKNLVWRFWARINRKAFAKAERVVTLGESMKRLVAQYCAEEQIVIAPLWSASSRFSPVAKDQNPFVLQHGIAEKFTVLYSGNIGYTHSVEVLVEVARRMRDEADVLFLIIGHGKKKAMLEKMVKEYGLANVMMLDFQPLDVLPYSLASADLGVVTLDDNVAAVSVPSKTFNLFAVGAPVLAIANERTEMHLLLSRYGNGRCIPKDHVDEMVAFIRQLKGNPDLKHRMSEASLCAARDFTFANASLYFK